MKKFGKSRVLALAVLVVMMISMTKCGLILYPERRGQTSGSVDPVVLVMDCLWLIPGIIPGVVALVVDFTTGGMYESGGSRPRGKALNVHPGDRMALNINGPAPADAEVTVTVSDGQGEAVTLLDKSFITGEEPDDMIILTIPKTLDPGNYRLAVNVNGAESSSMSIEVAP